MSNPNIVKNFTAGAAIPACTLVKFSAAETVVAATSSTDLIIGVTTDIPAAAGERCDVILEGIAFVNAGAVSALGARLTSDASGRVITAAPAVGVNAQVSGIAFDAALAAGDIIRVLLAPSVMQG
ncbi:capsid cement protein [uncultured Deefgea sp.]|uniref:capsid cement protein n=1 Tax=uncultured Deefgea sp. TaxID=1304914 RepID=UPI0025960C37|nr:capsid cement protein [uncultured Deefgea sp.]